ncbi:cation:proton antiporter [Halorientalis halophila]|uniref:cation:proton antiporter n=1 Tax=Halorientalis halophila TaxID=3108499 RepID=UPI0030096A75
MGIEGQLWGLLALFGIAAVVGVLAARDARIQYTIGLVVTGLLVSALGPPIPDPITSEFILLVLLPALIFRDAVTIDARALRANLTPILLLAVVGFCCSIALVAVASRYLFGFSLVVAVLFGAIVMPTDPVSVVAIFEELDVPDRLAVLVEGESLLNDGVAIVVYATVLGVLEAGPLGVDPVRFHGPVELALDVGAGITVAFVGGVLVGGAAGALAAVVVAFADDRPTAVIVSVLTAYGVYLLLYQFGTSGVIGTLAAGFVLGAEDGPADIAPEIHFSIGFAWDLVAVLANTIVFVSIGLITPVDLLVAHAPAIAVTVVLAFLARALVVYPLLELYNWWQATPISRAAQHVVAWSGIHAAVSVALVLDARAQLPTALAEEFTALLFGVAAFTLVVNGTTMSGLVDRLDLSGDDPWRLLYDALVGRLHGVDAALETADSLFSDDEIPESVYIDITAAYRDERTEIVDAIEQLLRTYPALRAHERRRSERRVLQAEHEAIKRVVQRGEIRGDVGESLLADVERELDRVLTDDQSIRGSMPPAKPHWRELLDGVPVDIEVGTEDWSEPDRETSESEGTDGTDGSP